MAEPSRIKEIPQGELTEDQKSAFEAVVGGRGHLPTPYKIWIHSPRLMATLGPVGTYLNKSSSLKEREFELLVCMTANNRKGDYVFGSHAKRCLKLGFPQSVLDAICAGQTPKLDDERERAIYELAMLALEPGGGSDEVYNRAEKLIGRNGIAEVLATLGYYGMVAMAMKVHRVPLPARAPA